MSDFDMPPSGTWAERGGWVVRALAREFGLEPYQAAGLVGNLGFESRHFTAFHEDGQPEGKGGYGFAQWTADRRVSFFAWCQKQGLDPKSDEANYGYLCEELRGPYQQTVEALRRCPTIGAAVWSVGQTYERPGGTTPSNLPGYAERLAAAQEALSGAGDATPTVADIQRRLVALGFSVEIDDQIGPQTCGAIMRALQRAA